MRAERIRRQMELQRAQGGAGRAAQQVEDGVYRMAFGKHRGQTIMEVQRIDENYLQWCVSSKLHLQYTSLRAALAEAGLLDGLVARAPADRVVAARVVLARAASDSDATQHREVRKWRAAQVEEAKAVVAADGRDNGEIGQAPAAANDGRAPLRKRWRPSVASKIVTNCSHCGDPDHRSDTCPAKETTARNRRVSAMWARLRIRSVGRGTAPRVPLRPLAPQVVSS